MSSMRVFSCLLGLHFGYLFFRHALYSPPALFELLSLYLFFDVFNATYILIRLVFSSLLIVKVIAVNIFFLKNDITMSELKKKLKLI